MANSKKLSSAEVVRQLTKESIKKAGKPEVSIEEFQRLNQKYIKALQVGITLLSVFFLAMLVVVAIIGVNVVSADDKNNVLIAADKTLMEGIDTVLEVSRAARQNITLFNSGEALLKIIRKAVQDLPSYITFKQLVRDIEPIKDEAFAIMEELKTSGTDTIYPEARDIVADALLQAYYPQWQGAFFDRGCHHTGCVYTEAENHFNSTIGSVKDCLRICHALRQKPSNGVEYGLTYDYKSADKCYCKTTLGHRFYSDDTDTYVFYRFS